MLMQDCIELAEWMNKKYPGWYRWATAKKWTWSKMRALQQKSMNRK